MNRYVTVEEAIGLLERESDWPNHEVPNVLEKTVERIEETDGGECLWDSYETNKRLDGNEPAPTVIGKDWKFAHHDEPRPLTVRERAALQTFPLDYEFHGNRAEQRQQTADAVPPKLAESMADALEI
jgi:site-specific DNA-cytosine methylase